MNKRHKVVVLGNARVGKTSLILRLITGAFRGTCTPTFGVDWLYKDIAAPDGSGTVSLHIWDTGGIEHYSSMQPLYLRDAAVVILCYALTDRLSFDSLGSWNDLACAERTDVLVFLVGTKCDQEAQRAVAAQDAKRLSVLLGCQGYLEVSAADGTNIQELFGRIAQELKVREEQKALLLAQQQQVATVDMKLPLTNSHRSMCSC